MPCPFFEPRTPLRSSSQSGGRLPLIEQYDGVCHASQPPLPVPETNRFRLCNHGNSKGECPSFPVAESRSCLRYEMIEQTPTHTQILCVEEQAHAPLRWSSIKYDVKKRDFEIAPADVCVHAQALAFTRSFLFKIEPSNKYK
jgi:hypothetical protein